MPARGRFLSSILLLAVVVLGAGTPRAFAATESQPAAPAFVVDGGGRVQLSGSTKLTLNCDLRNNGVFTPAAGSGVIVNGYLNPGLVGVASFANLTMAAPGGASLWTNATVNGVLTLTSGKLSLQGYNLVANSISGGSAASYIVTPDTLGRLQRAVGAGAQVAFPVGNSTYDPVTIRLGTGTDNVRVAVMDAPPATGVTAAAALTRAWAVGTGNAPGVDGNLAWTVQWNAAEQGASFDRTFGNKTSAWAFRWSNGAWQPQPNVRTWDSGAVPAVDSLVSPLPGLWTLASGSAYASAEGPALPRTLELSSPYPNPFRGATNLRYGLPAKTRVMLEVYSVLGERVATLADGEEDAGWHVARLASARMACGVYFVRLQAGREARTTKLVVMK